MPALYATADAEALTARAVQLLAVRAHRRGRVRCWPPPGASRRTMRI